MNFPKIDAQKGYRVYRNLTRSVWSVQHYVVGKGWRLREHIKKGSFYGCRFKVYEAGRARTIREGKKYVHAYMLCEQYSSTAINWFDKRCNNITYIPSYAPCFIFAEFDKFTRVERPIANETFRCVVASITGSLRTETNPFKENN